MLFKNQYFFLSNFYGCNVLVEIENKKLLFNNVECAFQAQKNNSLAENFIPLQPLEAKKLGKQIPITTPDWDHYRLYAMANCLNSKFKDRFLLMQLKQITEDIAEDNYWNDTFWGVYKGEGKNMLGKMLMNIRDNNNDLNILYKYIEDVLIKEV